MAASPNSFGRSPNNHGALVGRSPNYQGALAGRSPLNHGSSSNAAPATTCADAVTVYHNILSRLTAQRLTHDEAVGEWAEYVRSVEHSPAGHDADVTVTLETLFNCLNLHSTASTVALSPLGSSHHLHAMDDADNSGSQNSSARPLRGVRRLMAAHAASGHPSPQIPSPSASDDRGAAAGSRHTPIDDPSRRRGGSFRYEPPPPLPPANATPVSRSGRPTPHTANETDDTFVAAPTAPNESSLGGGLDASECQGFVLE